MRIGLVGTYDVDNFGDCAFPSVYRFLLKQRFPDASLTLYSPYARASKILDFPEVKALPGSYSPGVFNEDALLLTGGETISFGHNAGTYIFPSDTFSAFLRLWLAPLLASADSDTRFIAHCVGGKLGDPEPYKLIGELLRSADLVTFRDVVSQDRLSGGKGDFAVAIDPMFALEKIESRKGWHNRSQRYLPSHLRDKSYIIAQASFPYIEGNVESWAQAVADIAIRQRTSVLFLPICHFLNDAELLTAAREKVEQRLLAAGLQSGLLPERINIMDTTALIGSSAGYVGTSLHGAVTAVSFGLPLAVLAKSLQGKHQQTLAAAGIADAVTDRIAGLEHCFAARMQSDSKSISEQAANRALDDFNLVLSALVGPRVRRPAVNPANVAEMRRLDRAAVVGIRHHLNRKFLLTLQKFPLAYERYRAMRVNFAARS